MLGVILFDVVLAIVILGMSYLSFKKRVYLKIYEYVKILLLMTLSASFAVKTGLFLQKNSIISGDTYSVIVLFGFGVNIALIILIYNLLKKIKLLVSNQTLKEFTAISVNFIQILFIVTFSLYIAMQIYIPKKYFSSYLEQTYSYPAIKLFYMRFINDEFVDMIIYQESKTTPKEIIINSLKNGLN